MAEMTMVERVARAVRKKIEETAGYCAAAEVDEHAIARAALEALKEPPNDLCGAGLIAFCDNVDARQRAAGEPESQNQRYMRIGQMLHSGHEIKACWNAMIEAALSEEGK